MMRRSALLGVAAWVVVVAATSGLTWTVINAAGQEVLSGTDPLSTSRMLPAPGPTVAPRPANDSPRAGPTRHSPVTSPGSSPAPTGDVTGSASAASSRAAIPSSSTREPASSSADHEDRTWHGTSGSVVARCDGARVSLQSATPNDGYHVDVGSRGPEEVEVTFEGAVGETQVKAFCATGLPRFTSEGESEVERDSEPAHE